MHRYNGTKHLYVGILVWTHSLRYTNCWYLNCRCVLRVHSYVRLGSVESYGIASNINHFQAISSEVSRHKRGWLFRQRKRGQRQPNGTTATEMAALLHHHLNIYLRRKEFVRTSRQISYYSTYERQLSTQTLKSVVRSFRAFASF